MMTDKISIKGLIVLAVCSDGQLRAVDLVDRQARKTHGYIKQLHGGTVRLKAEPILPENKK